MSPKVTAARLRQVLDYDQETGVFTWRVALSSRIHVGSPAGSIYEVGDVTKKKYREIAIDGRSYSAQSLAIRYVSGYWPAGRVGFKDGDGLNLRYENLFVGSAADHQQRCTQPMPSSSTGLRGVSRVKRGAGYAYMAKIKVNMRRIYLGTFDTPEEASATYLTGRRLLQPGSDL